MRALLYIFVITLLKGAGKFSVSENNRNRYSRALGIAPLSLTDG